MIGLAAVQYDTINILSLPAFHWINVDYNPQSPRFAHSCNAVGGNQILVIGGVDANANESTDESTFSTSADPFFQGLAVFDMTHLMFTGHYTAGSKPYEQSSTIKEVYSQYQK